MYVTFVCAVSAVIKKAIEKGTYFLSLINARLLAMALVQEMLC